MTPKEKAADTLNFLYYEIWCDEEKEFSDKPIPKSYDEYKLKKPNYRIKQLAIDGCKYCMESICSIYENVDIAKRDEHEKYWLNVIKEIEQL